MYSDIEYRKSLSSRPWTKAKWNIFLTMPLEEQLQSITDQLNHNTKLITSKEGQKLSVEQHKLIKKQIVALKSLATIIRQRISLS